MKRSSVRQAARIIFWCAAIFAYVCALAPGDPHIVAYDKGNHMIAFGALAVLARLGWSQARALLIGAALVAFGAFIEVSQAVPLIHRDASWGDLAADTIAVVAGLVFGAALLWAIRRMLPPQPADRPAPAAQR